MFVAVKVVSHAILVLYISPGFRQKRDNRLGNLHTVFSLSQPHDHALPINLVSGRSTRLRNLPMGL